MNMKSIVKDVCLFYNLNENQIFSNQQSYNIAHPRQLAMYLIRKKLQCSYPKIGYFFKKDHTTIIYAVAKVEQRLKNKLYYDEVATLVKTYGIEATPKITITFFPFSMKVRQNVSRL
tara:strand:- start:1309 stop:1659 length:351 start_codon:yes stop_codon:yes gene_type:complete